jgi:hypothetical protein
MYVAPESPLRSGDPRSRCDAACRKPCERGDFQDFLERARPNAVQVDDETPDRDRRKEEEATAIAAAAAYLVAEPTVRWAEKEPATVSAPACPPGLPDRSPPTVPATDASAGTGSTDEIPWDLQELEADRIPFLQRVIRVSAAAGNDSQTIRMRLCPPELGPLRLEIGLQDGAMDARLEVETSAARDLLLQNLPVLEERLRRQDIRLDRFEVDLADRSPDGQSDRASQRSPSPRERRRDFRVSHRRATESTQPTSRQTRPRASGVSRIDVTI